MTKNRLSKSRLVVLLITLLILFLVPRILDAGLILTADEPTWITRSLNFAKAIKKFDFKSTRQYRVEGASHPGVTLMWLGGIGVTVEKYLNNLVFLPHTIDLLLIKLPFLLAASSVYLVIIFFLYLLFGVGVAFAAGLFLALDPVFIAYSRLLHLDAFLSLLMFASILTFLYGYKTKAKKIIYLSGILMGLVYLTKVPGFALLPFIFFLCVVLEGKKESISFNLKRLFIRKSYKNALRIFWPWVLASVLTFILLWPAMWVDGINSLKSLFGAARIGTLHAHGTTSYKLNPWFYVRTLFLYNSPLVLALTLPGIFYIFVKKKNSLLILVSLLFVVYFLLGMTLGAKKGERYILPVYPHVYLLAGVGFLYLISFIKSMLARLFYFIILFVFILYQELNIHPYYLAYFNPLATPPVKIGLGEGLEQAAFYLNEKFDSEELIISSWYPEIISPHFEGKTFGLKKRNEKTTDYVILYRGMKGRSHDDGATKILDEFEDKLAERIIYINGLEYVWIYKN